ncbi:MAG: ABC transporter ATP-binding protein [Deltaproteobacteria bacterium]|nr:ABC transporter ATP-binding protein [Deltaproteobacteria bacterium]
MLVAQGINTYYGLSHILFDLSVEIANGEIVCVLGRNGVGKTTLMRTLMGLTPPRTGSVKFKGQEVAGQRPYQLARRGLGYVPADRRIFPDLTVRQNLEIAQKPGSPDSDLKPWTFEDVFRFFPLLKKLENRLGNQLSGGEQQVLSTARAVIGNADRGVSILLCEQNTKFAFKISSRGYIIDKGRVLYQGPVEELSQSQEVKDCLAI